MVDNEISKLIATIIYTLVTLVIVEAICVYRRKVKDAGKLTVLDSLYVGVIPLCSIVLLYFFTEIALTYKINNYIILVSCILIVAINIFFFVLFDSLNLAQKIKYEHELLKHQSEYYLRLQNNIDDTFQKIRAIKHDLKYQLLYLKAKTEENTKESMQDIKNVLDTLITDSLVDEFTQYTKNKKLNRLLNYKLFSLSKNKIPLDIKVVIREDCYIDEISLYTILGNAIDNAVRNFDCTKSDIKRIIIRIIDDCDNLYIKIANPYNKRLHLKNGLPVTDKKDESLHGIGIRSIKKIVESKNGYFNFSTADNIFTLEILLYDEIKYENSGQV